MPKLSNVNKEIIFNDSQKKILNVIFRQWRDKLLNKIVQSRSKQKQDDNYQNDIDEVDICGSIQNVRIKSPSYPDYSLQDRCSKNPFLGNTHIIKNCRGLQLSVLGPIFRRKATDFIMKDELEGTYKSRISKVYSQDLQENIKFARKLSQERINRAKNYYEKLQNNIKHQALNEIIEYFFSNFDKTEIAILLNSCYNTKCDYSSDSDLSEIYTRAVNRINKSDGIDIKSVCKAGEYSENNLLFENSEFKQTIDFPNKISNLSLADPDKTIDTPLFIIEPYYSNINVATDHLVSRVCNVSLEISKTVKSCIENNIFNTKMGKHQGSL